MVPRGETGKGLPADERDEGLLDPAWRLRTQSPELALAVGGHLLRQAGERVDDVNRLWAEALVVIGTCRIGRGFEAVGQGIRALRSAEMLRESEPAHALRVELAGCARALDLPLCGVRLLRPVLTSAAATPTTRAAVLTEAARCLGRPLWHEELDRALSEADRLYMADELNAPATGTSRAMLRAVAAAQQRRRGHPSAALEAAGEGMALLTDVTGQDADGGQARARLVLELVLALLDLGSPVDAVESAAELARAPVRATTAASVNWLRFALASRAHLSTGRVERGKELLRLAGDSAERHQLQVVLAESRSALADVLEQAGETTEAMLSLRSAHAAGMTQRRLRAQAERLIVEEFAADEHESESMFAELTEYLAHSRAGTRMVGRDISGLSSADRSDDWSSADSVAWKAQVADSAPAPVNGLRGSTELDATEAQPTSTPGRANGAVEELPAEQVLRRARRAAEEATEEAPGARPRYRGDSAGLGLSNIPGLVVTQGSGGRRRAPEPPHDRAKRETIEPSAWPSQRRRSRSDRWSTDDAGKRGTPPSEEPGVTGGVGRLGAGPNAFLPSLRGSESETTRQGPWSEFDPTSSDSRSAGSPANWPADEQPGQPEDEQPNGRRGGDRSVGSGPPGSRLDAATARWLDLLAGRGISTTEEPDTTSPDTTSPAHTELARDEANVGRSDEQPNSEPGLEPPIPFRRRRRSRSDSHGGSREKLELGDLLTEAMMAFHNGTRPQKEPVTADTDNAMRDDDQFGTLTNIGWPSATSRQPTETGRSEESGHSDIGAESPGNRFSMGPFDVEDDNGDDGDNPGGAHAGGRRPGLEWRLSDRPRFDG